MREKAPDYGNWISGKTIVQLILLAVLSVIFCALSFSPFSFFETWNPGLLWTVRILLSGVAVVMLARLIRMVRVRWLFSYTGGGISGRILNYVLSYLAWDGKGSLLDVGCGSGALSIKAAKKYPAAKITGVDFWEPSWAYTREQCEENAVIEGVRERIVFQKEDAAAMSFADGAFDAAVSNFVFHEVKSQPDKRLVVKEALRVVKPGGTFVFQDLFYNRELYGDPADFVEEVKRYGVSEIEIVKSVRAEFLPRLVKAHARMKDMGLIYGKK